MLSTSPRISEGTKSSPTRKALKSLLTAAVISSTACDRLVITVNPRTTEQTTQPATSTQPNIVPQVPSQPRTVAEARQYAHDELWRTELAHVQVNTTSDSCIQLRRATNDDYGLCSYQIAVDVESGRNTECRIPASWFFSVSPAHMRQTWVVQCSTAINKEVCTIINGYDSEMQRVARGYCAFQHVAGMNRHVPVGFTREQLNSPTQ